MTEPRRSRFRSILRWTLPVGLALVLLASWSLFLLGGMAAVIGWSLLIGAGQLLAPLSLLVLVVHAVRKRRFSRPIWATLALALVALWPGLWGLGLLTFAFPYSLESSEPSATVRLPSNEQLRILWGGDRLATNYHAAAPDQRWAYDLAVEPALHGSENLEDYGCYGTSVVAPVSGHVHHAVDGAPDHPPGQPSSDLENPTGNTVVLQLESGTYLIIAHLKTGSVQVETGGDVEEGDPIGACGNSGNTSEPHIHIHHQRQDPRLFPLNFAEGLPLYFRDHGGPAMPEGGFGVDTTGNIVLTGAVVQHCTRRTVCDGERRPAAGVSELKPLRATCG